MKKNYFCLLAAFVCLSFLSSVSSGQDKHANSKNNKSFYQLLKNEDIGEIKTFINPKNVNLKDSEGNTPLLTAARNASKAEIIDILVNGGANIEERDKNGYTPLMVAIRKNSSHPEIALALIKLKANVNAAYNKPYDDEDKTTPLMYAVGDMTQNKPAVIQALLDAGADVNAKNATQDSPLSIASRYARDSEIIDILVNGGANIEERDKNGYTPLMIAIRKNSSHPEIALALIKLKANVNAQYEKSYDDEDKTTPLMYAVGEYMQNKPSVIQSLLDAGADVNAKNAVGDTPLLIAARYGTDEENVDILIKSGAKLEEQDAEGRTPLMRAVANETHPQVAISLIKNKANVNAIYAKESATPIFFGMTAYHHAKTNVIQALVDYGANINIKDIHGKTPLMYAVQYLKEDAVKVLIKANADLNAVDNKGRKAQDYTDDSLYMKGKNLKNL
ncbi:MAG: ankyrin repeat domain-containing protein [Endomicrobium sp.]|jgi:ankyrin repeat protein|nr:ankyrin repeat domain-containing protein [Endomicrobium sp.]